MEENEDKQDKQDKKFDIGELLEVHRRDRERLAWEGSFRDYFELVLQNSNVSKLSHARICDMITGAGVEKINEGSRDEITRYGFFSESRARSRESSSISSPQVSASRSENESFY
jgi:serine protein kinase